MSEDKRADVVIVGGGIIGMAIAWRACQSGMSAMVLERDTLGQGTSRVAAGMLAPVVEVEFGQAGRRLLDLGLHSAELWPAFATELEAYADVPLNLMRTGTLLVARDEDDARELDRQLAFRESLGLAVTRLRPSEARECEPALAPTIRLALAVPEDDSIDPRLVLPALRRACAAAGVVLREHAPVAAVQLDGAAERATGVTLMDGEQVSAGAVVLAMGPWSEALDGLPLAARVPVRPVKGQLLRLRDPAGPGLLRRVVRFEGGYVVPREDGRYVVGATVEERGFELAATAGGVYEMLRAASELVPGISELEIEELSVGLRPGTPDNAPIIGPASSLANLVWATGHYRNGILLAPLTAALVVELLAGGSATNPILATCSPQRFATVSAAHGSMETADGAGDAPLAATTGALT